MACSPRSHRRATWAALALSILLAAMLLTSWAMPAGTALGRFGARLQSGSLELVECSHAVGWRQGASSPGVPIGARSYWTMSAGGGWAAVLDQPGSAWRPIWHTDRLSMGSSPASATLITLRLLFVPLWPLLVLSGAATAALWWLRPSEVPAGGCRRCGYDVRGIRGNACPECGQPIRRFASLHAIVRATLAALSRPPAVAAAPAAAPR